MIDKTNNFYLSMFPVLKLLHVLVFATVFLKNFTLAAQDPNQFIYHDLSEANLYLDGIAKIHPSGLLELTNISYQQLGHAFCPTPFKFSNSSSNNSQSLSFSTNFVFAIVPQLYNLGGHGIAFTMSPSKYLTGAWPIEYLGLFNNVTNGLSSNHVLAVEFDTVLTPNFRDINKNHVGIDVNGLISNDSAPVAYYSEKEGKNKSLELICGNPINVWIDYDGMEKLLNVTVAPITSMKPEKPLLSVSIDLSLILSDTSYIGFSSSTGSMASSHYILGWSFNKSGPAQNLDISNLPPWPPKGTGNPNLKTIVSATTASVVLITIFGAVYILRRKKFEELREEWEKDYGPQRFSYRNLYKATKGFTEKQLLGIGGFGRVYRGELPDNTQVAVKKVSHDSQQGMEEFVAEIVSMGKLRHWNLVQLLGYCRRKGELLLVYDYMPNGSLDKFLFQAEKTNLNWIQRCRILKGVASALLYLHEGWEQMVLHRDVKASNVMLDAEFNGRLGDFGLAKFYGHGSIPQTTRVVGTVGYLAPEVAKTGRFTASSDVFSFGTLMLEVACGRRPIEPERPREEMILVDWVLDCWKRGVLLETSDLRLEGKYMVEEMELVLKLGLLCTHPTPAARPIMRQVVQYLDWKATLPDISMDGSAMGFIRVGQEAANEIILSFRASNEYSTFSITESILSCGR